MNKHAHLFEIEINAPEMHKAKSWFQGDDASVGLTGTAKVFCDRVLLMALLQTKGDEYARENT